MSEDLDLEGALEVIEAYLLGEEPSLTRVQVAEQAGVPLETAMELWHLMGFAHVEDDVVAFTPADVKALQLSTDLMELGVLGPDRQSALVRTWGRSYARLAEWQTALLADVALERGANPADTLAEVTGEVLPRVEALQSYVWRRHLVSAGSRLLAVETPGSPVSDLAVCFVDIVGYTSRSKALSEAELVDWLEHFESQTLELVVEAGGRIIKNIGDEVLFVTDDPVDRRRHRARDDPARCGRRRQVPRGPRRDRVRRGREPAGRRVRPGGQHRVPAHLGRAAGQRADRPRRLRGAVGPGPRRRGRSRRERVDGVPLQAAAPALGEGLRATARLVGAPGQRIVT